MPGGTAAADVVVELHRDPKSSRRYYINPFTKQSVWVSNFHKNMRPYVQNVDRDVVVVEKEAAKPKKMVVELHPHGGSHFFVHPFTRKSVWMEDFHSSMQKYVQNVDRDVIVVLRRKTVAANPQSECAAVLRAKAPRVVPCRQTAPSSKALCQERPKYLPNCGLRNVYITVTSGRPSSNKIPLDTLNPGAARLVDLRLHKAMIPVSEYAVDAHNNNVWVQYGAGHSSAASVAIEPYGNYCAGEIGARLQTLLAAATGADFKVELSARLNRFTYSADTPFRFVVSDAARLRLCSNAAGLDGTDTTNTHRVEESANNNRVVYLAAKLDANTGRYVLTSTHIDVSGPRMLLVKVPAMHNRLVDAVSLVSNACGGKGFVRYENPHSGGAPASAFPPFRLFETLLFTLTTPSGRVYNLNGVAATYVFQLTMNMS